MQRVRQTFETLGDDEEVEVRQACRRCPSLGHSTDYPHPVPMYASQDKMLAVGRRSVALEGMVPFLPPSSYRTTLWLFSLLLMPSCLRPFRTLQSDCIGSGATFNATSGPAAGKATARRRSTPNRYPCPSPPPPCPYLGT